MKDEIEDWIRFHCIEEDQTVRRSRTRDTRKAAGVPLGRKEVDEIFQERETMYESLAFLRQHRNTTVVEFLGESELKMKCRADNSRVIYSMKEKKLSKMNVGRRASEEGQVLHPGRDHRRRRGGVDLWRGCCGRGVALVAVKDAMGQSVRTSKYFGLFSVQIKGEEMRSTPWTCAQSGFLQEEDSKAQQRQTRGTIVISRSLRGITVEVIRAFQQESVREKRLLVRTAEALV